MIDESRKSVADSLETKPALVVHMPYLLQDMWALGSSADLICKMVGKLNLKSGGMGILDLGCGKGAVGIKIASAWGIHVTGIDLMEEFLSDAREKAKARSVSHLCNFIMADIIRYVKIPHYFELVILASLGNIFGSVTQTVKILRTQVAEGGYIMIDDGFLKSKKRTNRRGYGHYRNHEESIKALTKFGDRLLEEADTSVISSEINRIYLEKITNRARELIARLPELRGELEAYLRLQADECNFIDKEISGALWLLQKR